MPNGLMLNASTGEISGEPTTIQNSPFTIQVTDSANPTETDTQALTITIAF
ncbi:putative Ig domain-containing protein [Salmonella sp. SAL4450]|uniref:putative Ig domain-containing protein n=1 Tax=Salmonella sp. SAL4450 TaxID=3159905 RepID=UPI00397D8DF6